MNYQADVGIVSPVIYSPACFKNFFMCGVPLESPVLKLEN